MILSSPDIAIVFPIWPGALLFGIVFSKWLPPSGKLKPLASWRAERFEAGSPREEIGGKDDGGCISPWSLSKLWVFDWLRSIEDTSHICSRAFSLHY